MPAGDSPGPESRRKPRQVIGGKPQADGGGVLIQIGDLARAGNRNDVIPLRQQPAQHDLRHRHRGGGGHLVQQIEQPRICGKAGIGEARQGAAEIVARQFGRVARLPEHPRPKGE